MIENNHMRINMAAASDVGTVRKENEDSYYYSEAKRFFVVCDGMGGHTKGAVASKIGCETLRDLFFAKDTLRSIIINSKNFDTTVAGQGAESGLPVPAIKLVAGIRFANRRILGSCFENKNMLGMGTTVVVCTFFQGHIIFAHLGDSRIYRLRNGVLTGLTTDHSWLNELLEDNEICEKEAKNFKQKNVLTRALGISPTVKIDLQIDKIETDDLYLLCSDGLHNALGKDLLKSILTAYHGSLQNKATNLVNRAKIMDGSDNITAGLIHIADSNNYNLSEVIKKQITVQPESAQVTEYLDQAVKNIYPEKIDHMPLNRKRFGIAGGAVAVIALLGALLFFHPSEAQKNKSAETNIALFTQKAKLAPTLHKEHYSAGIKKAGYFALVQIGDLAALNVLEKTAGIRVLDSFEQFRPGSPVLAGAYIWAIADKRENILYKKKNIILKPFDDLVGIRANQVNFADSDFSDPKDVNQINSNQTLIFLVGNFEYEAYKNASIFVDDARFGALSRFKDTGFHLRSGVYDIKIVSNNNKILQHKTNVVLTRGATIALEF